MEEKTLQTTISGGSAFPLYINMLLLNGEKGAKDTTKFILQERILRYVQKKPRAYISEISDALSIPIQMTFELISDLKNKGKIKSD